MLQRCPECQTKLELITVAKFIFQDTRRLIIVFFSYEFGDEGAKERFMDMYKVGSMWHYDVMPDTGY